MTCRTLIGLFVIVAAGAPLVAQSVPLPAALVAAKTIAVVNGGVDQDEFEWFVQEIKGWKRFTFVEESAGADVAVTLNGERVTKSHWADGQGRYNGVVFRVSFKHGDSLLYSDTLKGCCTFRAMLRNTLERLDKRLHQEARRP